MPRRHALVGLLVGSLLACEPETPFAKAGGAATSEHGSKATPCPQPPAWAGELPSEVLAEVLHLPATEGREVGYRVHEDGTLETYAEVELVLGANGAVASRAVPGRWKEVGRAQEKKLAFLRRQLREASPEELEAWAWHRGGDDDVTLIRLRRDGQIVRSCYFGDRAPPPLGAIERQVLDLRLGILPPPSRP